jgi:uncharacterized repeat protein (TIGR01451 family)
MKTTFTNRSCIALYVLLQLFLPELKAQSFNSFIIATNDGTIPGGAKIQRVNKATGAVTTLGTLSFPASGAAYDPFAHRVYYTEASFGGTSPYGFAYYDLTTNTNTVVTANQGTSVIVKLAVDPTTGILYGMRTTPGTAPSTSDETLYSINKTTGALTLIGLVLDENPNPMGVINGDLAFTKTGICYYIANEKIYTINITTGTPTFVANSSPANDKITGITVDENDDIFVSTFQSPTGSCGGTTDWMGKLDLPAGTLSCIGGAATNLGDLTGGYGVIGISKNIFSWSKTGNQFTINYDVKVKNYGNARLRNIQITDNLFTVFGSRLVSASAAAVGPLPTGITLNGTYNGNAVSTLLTAGSFLRYNYPSNTEFTVRITCVVNLSSGDLTTTFNNTASVTATLPDGATTITDASDNGTDPNPNNNNSANEAGEDDPTPFTANLLLPAVINQFTAMQKSEVVLLSWEAFDEINLNRYEIEKSADGQNWKVIGSAKAVASTGSRQKYVLTDKSPEAGTNYYRLKIIDNDGDFSISDVRKIIFGKNGGISIYPTLATHQVMIQATGNMLGKAATIRITSIDGRELVYRRLGALAPLEILDFSKFSSGKYIVSVICQSTPFKQSIEVIK